MSDLIDRQAAIDALHMHLIYRMGTDSNKKRLDDWINSLPSAQPEPCEDAVSREAVLDAIDEWKEACADSGHKETASDIMLIRKDFIELLPVTPKQRTGKWILDRSGAYCCSECMEPCAGYVMMKPRDKFCKMCGAKMEV